MCVVLTTREIEHFLTLYQLSKNQFLFLIIKLMFKKLILMVLAISSSYGMESMESKKESLENNTIKQNTEDVNLNTANNIQQYQNTFNTHGTNLINEHQTKTQLEQDEEKIVNIDGYVITKSRPFKAMTADAKDWARLRIYDRFSQSCQNFIQMAFRRKSINKKMTDFFYTTHIIRFCVLTGLEPQNIFLNELKHNIDLECYKNQPEHVHQKFDEIVSFLPKLTEGYRKLFIKKNYVDNFDI